MIDRVFIEVAWGLDENGLLWSPEIGDEVAQRSNLDRISILVDPHGLTPRELRSQFLWLPTVEQLIFQFEAREAFIFHAGINESLAYEAVIRTATGMIETTAKTLRDAFGHALLKLLTNETDSQVH